VLPRVRMACDPDAGCPAGLGAKCLMPLCWRPTADLKTSASLSSAALDEITEQFNLAEFGDRIPFIPIRIAQLSLHK
jgi:hypothetical protein